jgi:hypothetical protein
MTFNLMQVTLAARSAITQYYDGWMSADDELAAAADAAANNAAAGGET